MKRFLPALVVLTTALALGGAEEGRAASFGLGAGTVDPEGVLRTPWFTVNMRWKLNDKLMLEPEAGYWSKTSELIPAFETTMKDRSLGLNLVHPIHRKRVGFFVGAGLGVHLLESSSDVQGTATESERELKEALHLFGGLEYDLRGLTLFGAVRFDIIADANQSKIYGGVRFGK